MSDHPDFLPGGPYYTPELPKVKIPFIPYHRKLEWPEVMDRYRTKVISTVDCPACGAGATTLCQDLDAPQYTVTYVHDDRSCAYHNLISVLR